MALRLHRAERADALVDALADVLADAQPDPFAAEVVAVPARGVERWVTQRLSHRLGGLDGVCANVGFPSPRELLADCVAKVTGNTLEDDPWSPPRLTWALLDLPAAHLPQASGGRLLVAQHIARLFTSYAEQRPAMLRDWSAGRDADGAGGDLPVDLTWQAELWRRVRGAIGTPSPTERLDEVCASLRADPKLVELPERVSLFGPTRLTTEQVQVLAAVAEHRDVHLFLPHPSAALWDAVAGMDVGDQRLRRHGDPTTAVVRHPLLSSLGRDAREMQLTLARAAASDQHHLVDRPPATLLGRLQVDIRADRPPEPTFDLASGDRSLQVHACYGRSRQVEVLREALLGLLAADSTLEPRDVLVMCPDIEAYAPLISAVFRLGEADPDARPTHPGHRLRVSLADRSLRQTNPLLDVVVRLLDLADARVTASQVLDLLNLPPVRRRFHLGDDELERLAEWVSRSGVRWGLDATHRAPFALARLRQNTWEAGLDRLLLGVTMPEDELRWLDLALPLDDVDSSDVDLAGRLAELIERLAAVLDELTGERPLSGWLTTLSYALEALTSVAARDEWQLAQVRREFSEVTTAAGERADTATLTLADIRALLADRLAGRPTRANFRTGNLTMSSMVPMRSVPHRVICLLGLDDGVFPRTAGVDGDDVLARDPLVGERDRRSEDRQLLLDAMLAAEDHLVIVYTGKDERTGAERPPAVPLGEILDVVDATVRSTDGRRARERIVVRHPLQPFDARNFTPAALGAPRPFSYDSAALGGARAAVAERHPEPPLLTQPLPAVEDTDGVVSLDQLVRFLEHPVRGFFQQRLGIASPEEDRQLADELDVELVGLEKWSVGDRWLAARTSGADAETIRRAEWLRGTLPPGALGHRLLEEVIAEAELLIQATPQVHGSAESYDVTVPLPDGRVVAGTVPDVYGDTIARTSFSRLGPKHRVRAWVHLCFLSAAHPGRQWRAVTIGRGESNAHDPVRSRLERPAKPEEVAASLVRLRDRGLREPLPLPLSAADAYARSLRRIPNKKTALAAAGKGWTRDFGGAKDAWHVRLWGPEPPFAAVVEQPGFRELSVELWDPLLACETLEAVVVESQESA